MDPQVSFNELMAALEANDSELYYERFQNLSDWLMKGGFAPIVNDLGTIKAIGFMQGGARNSINDFPTSKHEIHIRELHGLINHPDWPIRVSQPESHSIQLVHSATGPYRFEFCVWNENGKLVKRFPLRY